MSASTGAVSEWMAGRRVPSSASCLKLADVFHADPDYVLALAGHRERELPLAPEDPAARLCRLLRRVDLTPDRVAGLEATIAAWLERDRGSD